MVDREIFSRRLEALRGYLVKLRAFREPGEVEFVREAALHDLAERYLHLAVEACLDLGNHWIADRSLPTPDANRDTFTILERAGELSPDLSERLRGRAWFRNILVHEYLNIDHGIAYRHPRRAAISTALPAGRPGSSTPSRDGHGPDYGDTSRWNATRTQMPCTRDLR